MAGASWSSTRRGCAFRFETVAPRLGRAGGRGDTEHGHARRAADRRDGCLRRRWRCGWMLRTQHLARRWTCWARRGPTAVNLHWALSRMRRVLSGLPAETRRRGARCRRRRRSATRTSRLTMPSASTACSADPRDRRAQECRAAGQHPHPLQRRLAGDGRLGHGAGADLHGA